MSLISTNSPPIVIYFNPCFALYSLWWQSRCLRLLKASGNQPTLCPCMPLSPPISIILGIASPLSSSLPPPSGFCWTLWILEETPLSHFSTTSLGSAAGKNATKINKLNCPPSCCSHQLLCPVPSLPCGWLSIGFSPPECDKAPQATQMCPPLSGASLAPSKLNPSSLISLVCSASSHRVHERIFFVFTCATSQLLTCLSFLVGSSFLCLDVVTESPIHGWPSTAKPRPATSSAWFT